MRPEHEKKSLRNRLIVFFAVMLGAILVSEALVSMLTDRMILPSVQAVFVRNSI